MKVDGRVENIYKNLHTNQKIMIYEMLKRGISVEVLDEGLELIKTKYGDHEELIYDRDSSITPYHVSVLAGNKGIVKEMLQEKGISVPIGAVFKVTDGAYILEAFKVLGTAVIKPVFGSHGYDVYMDLNSEADVLEALEKIIKHRGENTEVLIEEYFPKKEHRVFITKNGDYAVLQRDAAHVYGDGVHTIGELIEIENYKRFHPRCNALCEILVDEELHKFLEKKGLSLSSILKDGEKVYVRGNSNVAMGGVCIDYTDVVHESVLEIGMKVLDTFPGLPYVGIDFMCDDITKEQTDESYRIIEINTVPGVHMHYRPAIGKSQNIAKYMVDLIYPETKEVSYNEEAGYQKSIKRF